VLPPSPFHPPCRRRTAIRKSLILKFLGGFTRFASMNAKLLQAFVRRLLGIVAVATLIYGVSFMYFIRSHSTCGLRGPLGHRSTSIFLEVPDTPLNRVLSAIYAPATSCFFGRLPIAWEKP